MPEYDNTNRGVLFKNTTKEKETHADYRGNINVDGVEFWLDAWIRDSAKGKLLSLSVKRKDVQPQAAPQQQREAPRQAPAQRLSAPDPDDMVPF